MTDVHPFYESQRAQIEESMRERLDLAEPFLRPHLGSVEMQQVRAEVMAELATVLQQMPYVGGKESRMTDFFVRLLGFMAIGRVLRRRGMPPKLIGEIGLQSYKAQLLKTPLAERLEAGRQFMSPENQALLRTQAAASQDEKYPEDFVYDFVEPGPTDTFDFGINYRACGFCKFAERHGDRDILPNICGLDFIAYETRGIKLERTQTLAAGATHCNFRFKSTQAKAAPGS